MHASSYVHLFTSVLKGAKYEKLSYSRFISLGANFSEWSVLKFSRNFLDLEIHDPYNRKTHMSEISHKAYAYIHERLNTGNR